MKRVLMILALITSIAAVVGIGAAVDARYAKSATVSQVSERLERKIDQDRLDDLQKRMWSIEDRWGERFIVEKNRIHDDMAELLQFMTPEARDHYRELEKEYKALTEKQKTGKKEDES